MEPITFPQVNKTWAEHQPEYRPLPSFSNDRETITCWRLSLWERVKLVFLGRVWLRQMNFGEPLQPQLPSVDRPFEPVQ